MCIAEAFARKGHAVTGVAQSRLSAYGGRKRLRMERAARAGVTLKGGLGAESGALAEWVRTEHVDVWVHHHHPMSRFRANDYDVESASGAALTPLPELFRALEAAQVRLVVQSGTYFEPGEGGQAPGAPSTPYAELKRTVSNNLIHLAHEHGFGICKIVIPTPGGALENEDRLTPQLLLAGLRDEPFTIAAPDSVFDTIPGEALAEIYVRAAEEWLELPVAATVLRPSGWIVSAGEWAAWVHERILTPLGRRGELVLNRTSLAPRVRFRNPESEKIPVDWPRFAASYVRDWELNYPFL